MVLKGTLAVAATSSCVIATLLPEQDRAMAEVTHGIVMFDGAMPLRAANGSIEEIFVAPVVPARITDALYGSGRAGRTVRRIIFLLSLWYTR